MKIKLSRIAIVAVLLIVSIAVSVDAAITAVAETDSTDYVHISENKTERERRDENSSEDNNVENKFMDELEINFDFIILITD